MENLKFRKHKIQLVDKRGLKPKEIKRLSFEEMLQTLPVYERVFEKTTFETVEKVANEIIETIGYNFYRDFEMNLTDW